jgi:hypothetical protein
MRSVAIADIRPPDDRESVPIWYACAVSSDRCCRRFPGAEPRFDEPFVIVDEELTVRSVSLQAEAVLLVSEPQSFGAPLESFLISECAEDELAAQIALAVAGRFSTSRFLTVG